MCSVNTHAIVHQLADFGSNQCPSSGTHPEEHENVICKHNEESGSFAEPVTVRNMWPLAAERGRTPWQEPKTLAHFTPHVSVFYTPIKCADTINRAPVSFCRIISLPDCQQLLRGYMTTVESQSVWITRGCQRTARRRSVGRGRSRSPPQRLHGHKVVAAPQSRRHDRCSDQRWPHGRRPRTKHFPEMTLEQKWPEKLILHWSS